MAKSKVIVGLSSYLESAKWASWDKRASVLPEAYMDIIGDSGARPVVLPPLMSDAIISEIEALEEAKQVLSRVDALVLIGGGDVESSRYGELSHNESKRVQPNRDSWELALAKVAMESKLPFLGICRGLQIMNVARGGTLIQHLPDIISNKGHGPNPGEFGIQEILVLPNTTLSTILGEQTKVLCSHHQAIDKLGEGLVISARSMDNTIEAIEVVGDNESKFALGVQWHPEESRDFRLIKAMIESKESK